ncbi:hypothetical protein BCR41DRAFT_249587 [Lobosporangium transversale]|uniref:Uncharacterized protein n=1 Tax=Lobosporangium transversale TaxID=64571 RepID=A0A1Y2G554_9FUNG|nr:hypothetical protein BCR41DRAFT_249587 [Lobosporangium transversale]ORY94288.1 hypothetical protein BCR41DRAFT_249587 [Lobosporangium transversale]|eukprot:XP_021875231.1 hypothetical protein BCR41DRAFT_249587 [Lobosporangium transversale]
MHIYTNTTERSETMSNQRQDEVDAFFNAIDSPIANTGSRTGTELGVGTRVEAEAGTEAGIGITSSSTPEAPRPRSGSESRSRSASASASGPGSWSQHSSGNDDSNRPMETIQRKESPSIFNANSAILPLSSSPSLSLSSSGRTQPPGTSPAIQKGSMPLGLALGGSRFRRKPLFDPDDDNDDNDDERGEGERKEEGVGNGRRGAGRVSSNVQKKRFQELIQSEYNGGTGSNDHNKQHRHLRKKRGDEEQVGIEEIHDIETHQDREEEDRDDDEDTNSETPLHPQETIRGLKSHHDFNFFKNKNLPDHQGGRRSRSNSFLSRLGASAAAVLGTGDNSGGIGISSSGGGSSNNYGNNSSIKSSSHMKSPRLGIGPFASASRLNPRHSSKMFFPRTTVLGTGGGVSATSPAASAAPTAARTSDPLNADGTNPGVSELESEGNGRVGAAGWNGSIGSMDHGSGSGSGSGSYSNGPSPIYPGGINPYHDDAVDWVVEGTGMRVAYDDFTTIGKVFISILF